MHAEDDEGSLEDQITKELATLKRPRKEQRFGIIIIYPFAVGRTEHSPSKLSDKYAMWCVRLMSLLQYYQMIFSNQVVFISCKPPVDPVKLVTTLIHNVHASGVIQSK